MSILKNITGKSHKIGILKRTLDYILEAYKTQNGECVKHLGCLPKDPHGSMMAVKRVYHKEGGRQFEESMLSITPAGNQYTNEELLKIGVECAMFWYIKGFQCTVALHLDSDFRHFHFVINSVSFDKGKKIKISPKDYNDYKTHCSRVLHNYGLDPIRTPATKIIDKGAHNFEGNLDFLECYDEIMADNGKCLLEMMEESKTSNYLTEATSPKKYYNPDAPTNKGPNRFMMANDPEYRAYCEWAYSQKCTEPSWMRGNCFEPWNVRPMSPPSIIDITPQPIIVREAFPDNGVQDEYYFNESGALFRINCARHYEITVPDNYTESQIKHIIENLPRMSEEEKERNNKRAITASGTFKNKNIDGQVELDFSETIKLNWSDGTSTSVSRSELTTDNNDEDEEIIDVELEDE